MRNPRPGILAFLAFLLLLLPPAAQAALTPVGAPLVISDETRCSFETDLDVIATPKGAFEAIWYDDWDYAVQARHFGRNLQPTNVEQSLLPLHGGLNGFDFVGTLAAGRYELVMNVQDFGEDPDEPAAAYRVALDLDGDPLASPTRHETTRFLQLAPAAGGDSLQFRSEPPAYGGPACRSEGLLASRIDMSGASLSAESRLNRHASGWTGGFLVADRLPNDTFVAVYSTCDRFIGLVARRLSSAGAPVGKPIDLEMPGSVGTFAGGNLVVAARGSDFAVAAMVYNPPAGTTGGYTRAVSNGKVFGPTLIPIPSGLSGVAGVVDLAASPSGGYLLLFQGASQAGLVLFAQELDARGALKGEPLAITGNVAKVNGAVASLPDGRWLVVTREQTAAHGTCSERLFGTVLDGG